MRGIANGLTAWFMRIFEQRYCASLIFTLHFFLCLSGLFQGKAADPNASKNRGARQNHQGVL